MKVGIIQPDQTPGDFPRNVRSLIDSYRWCVDEGAVVVVSPAFGLCGAGVGRLVERSAYEVQNQHALEYISKELVEIPMIISTLEPGTEESPGVKHAVYAVKGSGSECLFRYDYSNARSVAEVTAVVNINGKKVLLLIHGETIPYTGGKVSYILRLPTAPWFTRSLQEELDNNRDMVALWNAPIITVRAAGGQESNIHAGASSVINAHGELVDRLALFTEDCRVVKTGAKALEKDILPREIENVHQALILGIRDYVRKSGFDSVCLGLSGGIDSALVATLATEALGAGNVYGLALPSEYSSQGSLDDAYRLAENLGISCKTIPITDCFTTLKKTMTPLFSEQREDVTEENMQSRIRGVILMSYSNKFGHMLLSTGNKSEICVGYSTMYGDSCGGLSPIADLYKTEVYHLANHINELEEIIPQNTIVKAPSAELRPGQTDQQSLPDYETLDGILYEMVENHISARDLISRNIYLEADILRTQRLYKISEWKRRQFAPALYVKPSHHVNVPIVHGLSD